MLRVLAVVLAVTFACGGRSEDAAPLASVPEADGGPGDGGATDAAVASDPCACPTKTPLPGATCDCPGTACQFPPNQIACRSGAATCSPTYRWTYEYPANDSCPAELPVTYGLCSGVGSCEYEIDLGCGPAIAKLGCSCLDAAWLVGFGPDELPPVCDCFAITSEAVCNLVSPSCTWNAGKCAWPR